MVDWPRALLEYDQSQKIREDQANPAKTERHVSTNSSEIRGDESTPLLGLDRAMQMHAARQKETFGGDCCPAKKGRIIRVRLAEYGDCLGRWRLFGSLLLGGTMR